MFNPLEFQKDAIDDLSKAFISLWKKSERQLPLVFKAPTGSGKTFMAAHFIRDLNHLPNWGDVSSRDTATCPCSPTLHVAHVTIDARSANWRIHI